MAEIKDLSGTDANNTGTAANAGFPENMAYSDVNNAARALEGMIARHFADSNGTLTTTGSSNAYLLTPNRTVSAYTAGDAYMIKASFTNTGAVTINVSSLGAKSIVKPSQDALAAGELTSGGIYAIIFDGTNFQLAGADDPENLTLTSLTVTGATALNGNTTIGDAATDTVTITADVASDLIPSADGTHDLGAVGSEWQDLFIDGTANIDSLVADTADIDAGTIDGTVIGGSSAAAITGTTIVADTSVNIAGDGATVTGIKDENDMASDSATKLATQQSIKAYVDNQVTAQDLDFQADLGGALSVDLDSQTFTLTGGTGIDTSGSGQTVTFDIDSTVATLTGSQTLTNKTLTSPALNTGVSGTAILDEDNMASNSATQLATQQSIKTYVDNQLTAEDLDFQADSGGALSVDLDSQTFTLAGGTGIDSVGANQTVTFNIDSTVATLTDSQTLTNKTLTSPVLDTGVSGTAVLDEDNMASDSATKLATQQSIKAYVDAQITAEDLDFQADSGGALSVDLDSQTFTLTGGTGIDTVGSGQAVTFNIDDSTVATLTDTQTLTNKTLTSPDINTPDIDGGTIDNTTIGASTAAAGSFTTGSFSSDVSFADSSKAIFGAGSDLQIYHDGSNSYIDDVTGNGAGDLYIKGSDAVRVLTTNFVVNNAANNENMITAAQDGAVSLYHNGLAKIATTSTGIDVTGSVVADDLIKVQNAAGSAAAEVDLVSGGTWRIRSNPTSGTNSYGFDIVKGSAGTDVKMSIDSSGNATFSGSVTANAGVVVDNITIDGTEIDLSSGDLTLDVAGVIKIDADDAGEVRFLDGGTQYLYLKKDGNTAVIQNVIGDGDIQFRGTDGSSLIIPVAIDMSEGGKVGVGITTPDSLLHVRTGDAGGVTAISSAVLTLEASGTAVLQFLTPNSANQQIRFGDPQDTGAGYIDYNHSSSELAFGVNGPTRGYFNSSGHLVLGSASHNDDVLYVIRGNNGKLVRLFHGSTEAGALSTKSTGNQVALGSPTSGGGIVIGSDATLPSNANGDGSNNTQDLGSSSYRWATIFAQNALNTSDEKLKQDIEELSETERRVAIACKGLVRKYKFKEDVVSKGADAKIRIGIIAQQLVAAFEAEGLDAHDYALISLEDDTEQTETGMEKTGTQTYNVNYLDLLAFIISAI